MNGQVSWHQVLGVGAIGAAIVTGSCEDVDDAQTVLRATRLH